MHPKNLHNYIVKSFLKLHRHNNIWLLTGLLKKILDLWKWKGKAKKNWKWGNDISCSFKDKSLHFVNQCGDVVIYIICDSNNNQRFLYLSPFSNWKQCTTQSKNCPRIWPQYFFHTIKNFGVSQFLDVVDKNVTKNALCRPEIGIK